MFFYDEKTGAYMLQFHWFHIKKHILIKNEANPYDRKFAEYFVERDKLRKENQPISVVNSEDKAILSKQGCSLPICPICEGPLYNGEPLHRHHIISRSEGGPDSNLIILHEN